MDRESPIWIVGCPRSGTNWTWGLFNAHPDTDPLVPEDFGKRSSGRETACLIRHPDEAILAAVEKKTRRVFEKTPNHVVYIDRAWALFPGSAVVVVRRSAMGAINSMIHNAEATGVDWGWTLDKAIASYMLHTKAAQNISDDPRVVTVHYEDMLEDAEREMMRVFEHCGLSTGCVPFVVAANHRKPAFDKPGVLRRGEADSWKEEMTEAEKQYVACRIDGTAPTDELARAWLAFGGADRVRAFSRSLP